MEYYLAHHGIKGQKWGVRRWQKTDGSLTTEGYDHYGISKYKDAYKKALSDQKRVKRRGTLAEYDRATSEVRYRKQELSDIKTKAKLDSQKRVSKRQQKLVEDYKKEGLTQEEAEIAAYKRARMEKILAATLTTAAVTAAAYVAYKYADYAFDKTLDTNVVLSRVTKSSDKGVHDAFYAVNDKSSHDRARYAGLYAHQLFSGQYGTPVANVYEKKIGIDSAIKMASTKNAKAAFAKELAKGNNISLLRKEIKDHYVLRELDSFEKTGKISSGLYDYVNRQLPNRDSNATKLFYKSLRDAGYGAVKDVNDAKYSGFGTRLPIIVFDSSKVSVKDVVRLNKSEAAKGAKKVLTEEQTKATLKELAPSMAYYSGLATLSVSGTAYLNSKAEAKIVSEYRKEHPNSTLSRNEIVRNYYNEQQ